MRNVLYTVLAMLFVGCLMMFSIFKVRLAEKEKWEKDSKISLISGSGITLIDPTDDLKEKVDNVEIPDIPLEIVKPESGQNKDIKPEDIPVIKTTKPESGQNKDIVKIPPPPIKPVIPTPKASERTTPKASERTTPKAKIDYEPVLDERQAKRPKIEKMNWRRSVVDLLKLIFLPSSRNDRKNMAEEFGYNGPNGSFERNIWLHRQVKKKLETGEIPLDK